MTDIAPTPQSLDRPRLFALLPCAGIGARAGTAGPKQYTVLRGETLVQHTLRAFLGVSRLERVLLVLAPDDQAPQTAHPQVVPVRCGGESRAHSVFNGLQALRGLGAADDDWVLVHDAARCLIRPAQIDALIDACLADPVGGLLALKLPDTLKSESAGRVSATVDRADKWLAQTPQMFRLGALHAALAVHQAGGFQGITDEASAMERAGLAPLLVPGSAQNLKVTYPEDFALAEAVLTSRT